MPGNCPRREHLITRKCKQAIGFAIKHAQSLQSVRANYNRTCKFAPCEAGFFFFEVKLSSIVQKE